MRRIESLTDLEALGRAMFTHDLMISMEILLPPVIWDDIQAGLLGRYLDKGRPKGSGVTRIMTYTTTAGPVFTLHRGDL